MGDQRDITVSLLSDTLTGDELDVVKLVGVDQISGLFTYTIEAVRQPGTEFDEDALMLKPAWLSYSDPEGTEIHAIYGMIWKIREHAQPGVAAPVVEITLVPRTYASSLREMLDIFMEVTIPDIVEACLQRCGLLAGDHYELRLEDTYRPKEFVVQYRETDYAFICRLCEHHGIFFYVDHSTGKDVLVFGDRNAAFPDSERTPELPFRPLDTSGGLQFEHVQSVHTVRNPLPKRYTCRDYNYRMPGVDLLSSADVDPDGLGEIVEYGSHFKDPAEGAWFANIRAQELIAEQRVYTCLGNPLGICAGQKFMLVEHPSGDVNLLVTAVTHSQPGVDGGSATTAITAIPAEANFRPRRLTPKPKIQGIITGMIDAGVKDGFADVDDQGRYRVRFMFDTAGRGEGQASRLVRMAQPHAGEGYGMHFPLRPGTEVILSCIDGDPDRPIIVNTVPNPATVSPVSSANRDRNLIRTGGGNEIDISDEEGMHRIKMTTPHLGTVFQLGAENAAEVGMIISTHGNAVSQVADTVGSMADTISAIQDIKGSITGQSVSSVAGVPDPIKGFEAVDKMLQSGSKAIGNLAKTMDTITGFGKALNDSNKKTVATDKKAAEDTILKVDPAQKYPDNARTATVGTPPVTVTETEEQFRKRIVDERIAAGTAPADARSSYEANSGPVSTSYAGIGTLDGSVGDAYAESTFKKVLDTTSTALSTAAGVSSSVQGAVKSVKKLFSSNHKTLQKAMEGVLQAGAKATSGVAATSAAGAKSRMGMSPRLPGEHYNLIAATDSVVAEGAQGFYGLSPLNATVFGGKDTMVISGMRLGIYSTIRAEIAAPITFMTSSILNIEARSQILTKSGKNTEITVGEKLKIVSSDDTSMESKKKFFVKTKDLLDVDGGDEAKLKAKKWAFEATDSYFKTKVKGKYEVAADDWIELKHKGDSRFFANGANAMMENLQGGGKFSVGSSNAKTEVSGSSVEVTSSAVKLNGSSSIDIKASSISINGSSIKLG